MSEQKELYEKAKSLGLDVHHRTGVDKLKAAIFDHLQNSETSVVEEMAEEPVEFAKKDNPEEQDFVLLDDGTKMPRPKNFKVLSKMEVEAERKKKLTDKRRITSLRRVRITCMNPNKSEWPGEIISVGSAKLGSFKKFIPFNGEPYHVPEIIYNALKERKYSQFYTVTDERGQKVRKSRLVDEFAIEDLPPLSDKELDDLAKKQALAATGL